MAKLQEEVGGSWPKCNGKLAKGSYALYKKSSKIQQMDWSVLWQNQNDHHDDHIGNWWSKTNGSGIGENYPQALAQCVQYNIYS